MFSHRAQAANSDTKLLLAREQAAHRKRPLILDDDGDLVYAEKTLQGPREFLSLRMHDCRDSGVDSIAWCMMWGIAVKGKIATRYWQTQQEGIPFSENIPDPTPVVTDFCRANGIETFGSIRMNDSHDAFGLPFGKLVYPLKVAHPEMLIGDQSQQGGAHQGLSAAMWSGLNYAFKKVRDDRLWWIDNTARKYDLDGVDLNFFRMPWVFKLGEEEKNMPLMTEFIRAARRRVDKVSRERGRPMLLGVRVPGTIDACRRIGFDIETWLREGLVDRMLTGGGYVCYSTPAEELVKLGHRYEVPVYPCINCPAIYKLGNGNLRAAASNLWWAGADGIYLWNFHYISDGSIGYGRPSSKQYQKQLSEISDPARLKYLDKSFAVNHRVWEQYQRASAPVPLPLVVGRRAGDKRQTMPIRIGDDIPAAVQNGKLRDVILKLKARGTIAGDVLTVRFNDATAQVKVYDDKGLSDVRLPPRAIKRGVNQIELTIAGRGAGADKEIVINGARVDVRYRAV